MGDWQAHMLDDLHRFVEAATLAVWSRVEYVTSPRWLGTAPRLGA